MEIEAWVEFDARETRGKRKGKHRRAVYTINMSPFNPYVLVDKPWELLPEWPAGVMVGYYVGLPFLDSRASFVDMRLTGAVRGLEGTTIPLEMRWRHHAVDGMWKGPPGGNADDPALQPLSDEDLRGQGIELPDDD